MPKTVNVMPVRGLWVRILEGALIFQWVTAERPIRVIIEHDSGIRALLYCIRHPVAALEFHAIQRRPYHAGHDNTEQCDREVHVRRLVEHRAGICLATICKFPNSARAVRLSLRQRY